MQRRKHSELDDLYRSTICSLRYRFGNRFEATLRMQHILASIVVAFSWRSLNTIDLKKVISG
jgi:hypothetical protein